MFGYKASEYDKKVYEEELRDFLPDKIIDTHVHLSKAEFLTKESTTWVGKVSRECIYEDIKQTFLDILPGKQVKPVIMAMPTRDHLRGNTYIEDCIKQGEAGLFCTKFDTPLIDIEAAITKRGFKGIKPYPGNRPLYIPMNEVRIFDFMPHEQLKLLNDLGSVALLHIGRDKRLKDPVNVAQLMEIEEKYPNLKLIVAHIGRAYSPEDLGDAFETLKHTKNMMFDFCANTLSEAIEECLKAVGPKRLMYGTDMPVTKMRMRRITENGNYINIVPKGLYGDVSGDVHMRETEGEELTCFLYEELRAFKKAAQNLGLSKEDINDVFYTNASKLYGIEF